MAKNRSKSTTKAGDSGDAWLEQPGPFRVGTSYQFNVTYRCGSTPIEERGSITVTVPGTLGWTVPQATFREQPGYCTAWSSNPDVILVPEVRGFKMIAKAQMRCVKVFLTRGRLTQGQTVTVRIGDTKHGWGSGLTVGVVASQRSGHIEVFDVSVDANGSEKDKPVREIPLRIMPREADTLEVIAPSLVPSGKPFTTAVKIRDIFHNAVIDYQGRLAFRAGPFRGLQKSISVSRRDRGVKQIKRVSCSRSGISRIQVREPDLGIRTKSNPVWTDRPGGEQLVWGELHCHSAFSSDNKRNGLRVRPGDMYEIGRDANRLDFMCITDHHEPWRGQGSVLTRAEWAEFRDAARAAQRKTFLPLMGFEYSGHEQRGHTNVLFRDLEVPYPGRNLLDVETVWRHYTRRGIPFMTIPHLHTKLGRRFNDGRWPFVNPEAECLVEMYSCHGRFEYFNNRPWLKTDNPPDPHRTVQDLLAKGMRYGIVGGSDGHKGHPGQDSMTAVYVKALTRKALWDALRARRCYATTHARILLDVTLEGLRMGEESRLAAEQARDAGLARRMDVTAAGTEPILRVDVVRNGQDCFTLSPDRLDVSFDWADEEAPEKHVMRIGNDWFVYYYVRVIQADGEMAWSSPIWLTFE